MRKINVDKLNNADTLLNTKYGNEGTASREDFNKEAIAYYYGQILKERRKELNLTQENLAEKVGLKRSYIAKIEKGLTDMQMSSFIRISKALNLELAII